MPEINICGVRAAMGEKKRTTINVPGSDIDIPMTLINGTHYGPVLLLTSGIHGSEYPGTAALMELGKEISPTEVKGTIVMLHPVNVQAFWKRAEFVVPEDVKNLNRVFPGQVDGTLSGRTAHLLVEKFFPIADFYIDLHSGDANELLFPYIYYPGQPNEEVVQKSKAIAQCFDVPYMVRSLAKGGAYNYAASTGLPSVLVERGCCGIAHRSSIDAYKSDLYRAMVFLGVISKDIPVLPLRHKEVKDILYRHTTKSVCWFSEATCGNIYNPGDELGRTTNLFGEDVNIIRAERRCVLLYRCSAMAAPVGTILVAYGTVVEES